MQKTSSLRLLTVFTIALASCSSSPEKHTAAITTVNPPAHTTRHLTSAIVGQEIVSRAQAHIGTPYRFGGASPNEGFDCSGLVYYVFKQLGLDVPRTSREQAAYSRSIPLMSAQLGDILFFEIETKKGVSHVGIYAGNGRFIHAPKTGRTVSYAQLNTYWLSRLNKVGRLQNDTAAITAVPPPAHKLGI